MAIDAGFPSWLCAPSPGIEAMTPEELRALDGRVAELRGWRCVNVEADSWEGPNGEATASGDVPAYSTDPAASRVLLDEMAAAYRYICLEHGDYWSLCGENDIQNDPPILGKADAPDAAICLAWIAWKEAQA